MRVSESLNENKQWVKSKLKKLTKNSKSVKHKPMPTSLIIGSYFVLFVSALAYLGLFVDVITDDPYIIIKTHIARIILLVCVSCVAMYFFNIGWKTSFINGKVDLAFKCVSLLLSIVYLICMRNKYDLKIKNISSENTFIKNIHILSIYVFVAINAILVASGTQHLLYNPEKTSKLGMFFLILTSVSGVIVSGLSIKKVLIKLN